MTDRNDRERRAFSLRCFAFESRGQVIAVCLDLSLAAQADTLAEAKQSLHDQIADYVIDLAHENLPFERRPAPASIWLRYWSVRALDRLVHTIPSLRSAVKRRIDGTVDLFREEVPYHPA